MHHEPAFCSAALKIVGEGSRAIAPEQRIVFPVMSAPSVSRRVP